MSIHQSIAVLGFMLIAAGGAAAQTTPDSTAPATPNAVTPPGGIARGVVPPPANVDPEIVTPPPAQATPSMPVIKPPTEAR